MIRLTSLALALVLAGCANLAPPYEAPVVDTPVAFKEGRGAWVAAAPADMLDRGPWLELFDDPVLSTLARMTRFSSSRMFPGQRYVHSRSYAPAVKLQGVLPNRSAARVKKCLTSSGTSERRSRSGGTVNGTTFRR